MLTPPPPPSPGKYVAASIGKELIVKWFARQLLLDMGGIGVVDLDGDGVVTEQEVVASLATLYGTDEVPEHIVSVRVLFSHFVRSPCGGTCRVGLLN
jgi:hypothetical protein